jgi:hypothetical protein
VNKQLYRSHLNNANIWNATWTNLQQHIDENLQPETETLYNKLNKKIDNLIYKQKEKTHKQPKQHQAFYQCTINLTNIKITKEEKEILDYGLQYSLEKPIKTYWMNLIIETERTIKLLDNKTQSSFRILASKKLRQIYNSNRNTNATQKRQTYTVNKLKQKLSEGNAMLAQADKGKTTIIIYIDDYTKKVQEFLTENHIQPIQNNPTLKDSRQLQTILQQNNLIFDKRQNKHLVQKNPTPPKLNAKLKLHKTKIPIRPVVNNINAPTYKTAKKINNILQQCLQLKDNYNTQNSINLAKDLTKLTIDKTTK